MAIKLSLPNITDGTDSTVEVRPVYVEEWVESLAYANPPALLEQAIESLQKLNTQALKPALRMTLLDLHLKPYAYALNVRRTQDSAQTGTALNRQRSISRRLRLCATELALGYKQALSELSISKSRFGGEKDYRVALQRSLLCISQSVLHCYDEYRPAQPRLWLEIMALYKVAQKAGVAQDSAPSAVDDALFSQSTAQCFKRFCLTALVDPYHLAYGELWIVHRAFGEYANDAEILETPNTKRQAGLFVIDPSQDRSPTALAQYQSTPSKHCRFLDANPILSKLHERHQNSGRSDDLASHVLAAMIRALGLPRQRHTPREESEGKVNIAAGLSTVHHFIGGRRLDARPRVINEDDIEISDVADLDQNDIRSSAYRYEAWFVDNEGPGGIGIIRDQQPETPVGVGDLIGMQFPLRGDDENDWSIGVVRWLEIDSERNYQVGVQSLGDIAMPVTAFSESVTDTITRIPRPTLALPTLGPEPGNTLITPRGLFARGDMLRVKANNHSWLVQTLALSESTSTYDRFTYRVVDGA